MRKFEQDVFNEIVKRGILTEEYLAKIVALTKQVQHPSGGADYPKTLKTTAQRALFDNLGKDEALALALDAEIRQIKKEAIERAIADFKSALTEAKEGLKKVFPDAE